MWRFRKSASAGMQRAPDDDDDDDDDDDLDEEEMNLRGAACGGENGRLDPTEDPQLVPVVYKTSHGAESLDIDISGISSTRKLVERVLKAGMKFDGAIGGEGSVRIHYVTVPNARPKKVTSTVHWEELEAATALIVTPTKRS